jgi:thiol-disulfide isomerase/thioredoxin
MLRPWLLALFAASAAVSKPIPGQPAPDFALRSLVSKEPITLSAFRGKVVLLDFWASWCLPCKKLMPKLSELKSRLPELEVVAVSVDADPNKALTFLRSVEPDLVAAHDAKQKTAEDYALEGMPTCFLIDKQGRLRYRHDGYTAEDLKKAEREARLLLAEKAGNASE